MICRIRQVQKSTRLLVVQGGHRAGKGGGPGAGADGERAGDGGWPRTSVHIQQLPQHRRGARPSLSICGLHISTRAWCIAPCHRSCRRNIGPQAGKADERSGDHVQGVLRRFGLLRSKQQQLSILENCNVVREPVCSRPNPLVTDTCSRRTLFRTLSVQQDRAAPVNVVLRVG